MVGTAASWIFVSGEKLIDANNCQQSSNISGFCPNPPPHPKQQRPSLFTSVTQLITSTIIVQCAATFVFHFSLNLKQFLLSKSAGIKKQTLRSETNATKGRCPCS